MNQFDRRLRALAAKEKMIVPDTLHQRLVETIHTNVPERRYISILRFVVIAALIAILGTVTAGALRLIGNDEMGGYTSLYHSLLLFLLLREGLLHLFL